jgi:molecular chaperone HtpG
MQETGQISINTENILPIIKKWLYSEKEIFLRELVSNSVDAIHKLEKLALIGDAKGAIPEPKITVEGDKKAKTITITDTGIGMTAEEIKRYITQVAFSGVTDFVEKYKGKGDEDQIIGHFGLGFFSSFMVAEKVEIDTLSYQEGAVAAHWESNGEKEYILKPSDRKEIGTTITLHIAETEKDVLDPFNLENIARKFCSFVKYPLFLQGERINETAALWTKSPTELKEEDYKEFFQKLFPGNPEPLFWIHLNVDYPFKLRGILYFPKLSHELEASQGQVKLYCNQVYVEDNCKELIPEYLTLLKGAIDCPDLPLNVSRSALQRDATVQKISQHITKKVADKLSGMCKTERPEYERFWTDIAPFVKYAMLRDADFLDRMQDYILYKSPITDKYYGLDEYLEQYKDKTEGKILYTSDAVAQVGYLNLLKQNGLDAVLADSMLDKHFLPYFEMRGTKKYKFQRVDADVSKHLVDESAGPGIVDPADQKTANEKIQELFKKFLNKNQVEVKVQSLKSSTMPGLLLVDENQRRLKEMTQMGAFSGMIPGLEDKSTLIINQSSPAIKNLLTLAKSFNRDEDVKLVVEQIYDLAAMQQGGLSAEAMQTFMDRSTTILAKLGKATSVNEK